MADDCIFCKIIHGEIPSSIVYQDENTIIFKDINPAATVHWLAVPTRHVARLSDCGPEEAPLLSGLLLTASRVAKENGLEGFRSIINDGPVAGQTVFHLHMHILGGEQLKEKLL